MPLFRRLRKIERSGQRQEILEPFDFQGLFSHKDVVPAFNRNMGSLLGAIRAD
jgi:hypothetical protein